MAQDFSSEEFEVLRSAFAASDIDGDGFLSGLNQQKDVDALFNAFKKDTSGELITFEEFTKGVMDFPFLLEQYRVELEERSSGELSAQRRSNDAVTLDIDTLEEDISMEELSPEPRPATPRFAKELGTILEFPANPLIEHSSLLQAYNIFCNLLQQRGSLSWTGSQGEYRLEDYVDMLKSVLERLEKKHKDQSTSLAISGALITGSLMLADQLEKCVKAFNSAFLECRHTEESLSEANRELQRRCEMAESRSNLLFDRLRSLENEMEQEQIRQETILQESSRLQDLLKSANKRGEQTSQEIAEIHSEIDTKERQIGQLQQEIRRLNSRRVLREIPMAEDSAAIEVRNLRRERRTGGGIGFLARTQDHSNQPSNSTSPITSPMLSPRSTHSSSYLPVEKSRTAFRLSAHIQRQKRLLQEWETQLKTKEQDLGLRAEQQIKRLKAELFECMKQLITQKSRVRELELILSEGNTLTTQDDSTVKTQISPVLCIHTEKLVCIPGVKQDAPRTCRENCCPAF